MRPQKAEGPAHRYDGGEARKFSHGSGENRRTSKAKSTQGQTRDDLIARFSFATMFVVDVLDRGDAAATAVTVVDRVIDALRQHPQFPKLTSADWDLVMADVLGRITEDLAGIIDGTADYNGVINAIANEMLDVGGDDA